jgi:hypothetical protein
MAARGTGLTTATRYNPLSPKRLRISLVACVPCAVLALASPTFGAEPGAKAVGSLSQPKTAFQCERKFKSSQGRAKCFSELPGANCKHPLQMEQAGDTSRGESRYFTVSSKGENGDEFYTWAPKKNVAICPFPNGVAYKVSRLADKVHCERIRRNGHFEEYCSSQYATKNIPVDTGKRGGEFSYSLPDQPQMTAYLVIKGYFINPPWGRRG